jgi:tetratricopeptide (TPR) repeat protein
MQSFRHAVLAIVGSSSLAFAAPPASAAAAPPPAAKVAVAEYPLSCAAASKPLFSRAHEALFNAHADEARGLFKQLVAADPGCVMAKLFLGSLTPGAEGRAMVNEALGKTAGLTEVEKLLLQASDAQVKGDGAAALALDQKARDLAPNVYELNLYVASDASGLQRWDVAVAAARRATELNPKGGPGWNILGLAYVNQRALPEAVAALRKYVEVLPAEANAADSLGDALLANDQLDEAAAAYQKALDLSKGQFWMSWHGLATVKALRGDWDGARADLAKGTSAAAAPDEKAALGYWVAASWLAQGKLAEANKALDANEKELAAAKMDFTAALVPIWRGNAQLIAGKPADALKHFAAAEKVKTDSFLPTQRRALASRRLLGVILAQAASGRVAEAEKALPTLEALYKDAPTEPEGVDQLALARGAVALEKKDAKAAVASLSTCTAANDLCHLRLAEAQDKAGEGEAATQTRTALLKVNRRDPDYWWVRARAQAAQQTPGKKVAADGAKKK